MSDRRESTHVRLCFVAIAQKDEFLLQMLDQSENDVILFRHHLERRRENCSLHFSHSYSSVFTQIVLTSTIALDHDSASGTQRRRLFPRSHPSRDRFNVSCTALRETYTVVVVPTRTFRSFFD